MSVKEENRRRQHLLEAPYDPVTGVGCYGERVPVDVEDYGGTVYFPSEMMYLESLQLLYQYGGVERLVTDHFGARGDDARFLRDLFWLRLSEERYKYDFEFYAYSCQTIRDKETGQEIRFKLNRPQRVALLPSLEEPRRQGEQILVQVLKARQMGFSTAIQMYMNWIQVVHKTNWNSVVCADDLTSAVNVRSMYDLSILAMPPIGGVKMTINPFAGTKNIKYIPERGCRITVGTAQRPETVRSQDVKMVHFSEVAFYPHTEMNHPSMLESSIVSSIPNVPYTMVVRESTANGVGDYFHSQWERAKRGESGYRTVFAPWHLMEIYRLPLEGGRFYVEGRKEKQRGSVEDFYKSLSDYERNLWEQNEAVTLEHLHWRRWKLSTMSDESKMVQEFPSNDVEAFIASGNPVFDGNQVEAMRADCRPPTLVGEIVSREDPARAILDPAVRRGVLEEVRFVPSDDNTPRREKLLIWEEPDTSIHVSDRYVVAFDPQRGVTDGADWGVIKVFDRYWMAEGEGASVVALWYGHVDKDIAVWEAVQIARYYLDALLVVESNTYDGEIKDDDGEFIFDVIADHYPKLYARTSAEKIREGRPVRWGWQTNRNTKPLVINHYKALLRERGYVERDEETLNEARTYETKPNGTMGAKEGCHDDRLMATAIGLYVCHELPPPRVRKKEHERQPRMLRDNIERSRIRDLMMRS